MPNVTFIDANGTERVVSVENGFSVMEAAVRNNVPGIDGDCGGAAACATCHVFVDPAWIGKTGTANPEHERSMLEFSGIAKDNSRLACQIIMTDDLDGLVVRTPEAQF